LAWKKLSGFGYIAEGKGKFQGDALFVTRGTTTMSDWLSNFNIGMQIGPGGHLVHAGFHEVWKSFSTDIKSFMQGRNLTCVHCVGHSLGGALAALNADYLSTIGAGQVKLYTFGSPRAGSMVFSQSLTNRINSKNIFRVSHPSDPVPMIPVFPFQHLPHNANGLIIANGFTGLINVDAHSMEPSYIPGVEGKSWHDLSVSGEPSSDKKVKDWLNTSANNGGGFMMGSTYLLGMIGEALLWIIRNIKNALVGVIGINFTVGATIVDQLAWLIYRGVDISTEISGYVKTLIGAIFRFLGRVTNKAESLTMAFIRWVLNLLFTTLSTLAVSALSRIA
jgi:hypothetical protein